ncbi:TPA: hypothetical protein SMI27_005278 [Serratia liquefaciens]|nr:hypothetical protein [Serratia liquefaciens]
MHAISDYLLGVNDILAGLEGGIRLWLCSVILLTLLSYLGMYAFPSVRVRLIFTSRAPWLWRFLMGEFSVRYTLGWGVAGAGGLLWWCFAMGVWPPTVWALGMIGVWIGLVVLALFNAGRKSGLSLGAAITMSCVMGGLGTLGQWVLLQWVLVVLSAP